MTSVHGLQNLLHLPLRGRFCVVGYCIGDSKGAEFVASFNTSLSGNMSRYAGARNQKMLEVK